MRTPMRLSLLLLPLVLLLSACQTAQLERDFDPNRDFAAYRSWSWQEPAVQYKPDDPRINSDLTGQRIRAAAIDLLDGKDGKLVWRGSAEQILRNRQPSPAERETAIRATVAKVLSQYPPH